MNDPGIFQTFFFIPLYNGLIFLMAHLPWVDAGVAVIIFTCIVKLLLFPLSKKSVETQIVMKKLEPEITKLKEQYKDNQPEQAKQLMALYKERRLNPFSGVVLLFIQIPIIFALYFVVLRGGLPAINFDILYSFVTAPQSVNMNFLGLIDISKRNIVLALLAGITQFVQIRYSMPPTEKKKKETASFKDDFARSMQMQMRYVMPIFTFIIAYTISAAIALYWTTSNLFTIGQEIYIRRKFRNDNTVN